MGMVKEFREFALRGNVFDMAVGVVIGAAFGKVVTSVVNDILMPPLGKVMGNANFTDLAYQMGTNAKGEPVQWRYGSFLQTVVDFLIVALCVFALVRAINKMMRKEPPPPAPPTKDQELLAEIRDLLKSRS